MVLCSVPHVMRFSSEFLKKTSHQYRSFQCQVCMCKKKTLIDCRNMHLAGISPIDTIFVGANFHKTAQNPSSKNLVTCSSMAKTQMYCLQIEIAILSFLGELIARLNLKTVTLTLRPVAPSSFVRLPLYLLVFWWP